MSLILDALKKSDEARRRGKPAKRGSPYAPQLIQPRRPVHRYYLLIALALCLNAVLLVWWLRPWESGSVATVAREPAPAARTSVAKAPAGKTPAQSAQPAQPTQATSTAQTSQAPSATQVAQPTQGIQTAQVPGGAPATQTAKPTPSAQTTQVPRDAPATQVGQAAAPVDASSDSTRAGEKVRGPAPEGSPDQEGAGRIALAGNAGGGREQQPGPGTADRESAAETSAETPVKPGASSEAAPAPEPALDGNTTASDRTAAVSVKVPDEASGADARPGEATSAVSAPVPSDAPPAAPGADTSRSATREAVAKVNQAGASGSTQGETASGASGNTQGQSSPGDAGADAPQGAARGAMARVNQAGASGSTPGQASTADAGRPPGVAAAEQSPAKIIRPPGRQAPGSLGAPQAAMPKVKEADPPGTTSGQVPPGPAGNVRSPMPQTERSLPETAPGDAAPGEAAKTARQKPPGKAVRAPDGERGPAEGAGYPAQVGGSRELVSDLRSLMGAEDPPKKASASGRVLKYYELPSSLRDSMPQLSMSMLLHSKKSEERWVNINGAKVREGQEIASGLKVVEITPDGAVFSYKGQRFYKAVMGD